MLIAWKQGFAQWSSLLEKWLSLYVGFTALWENLENQGKIWKIGENLENSEIYWKITALRENFKAPVQYYDFCWNFVFKSR